MSEKDKLHTVLWNIADELRGNMDATKFKDYILGFIFYRYLSHNVVKSIELHGGEQSFEETYNDYPELVREECLNSTGYFIEPENLFDSIVAKANKGQFILDDLSMILNAIEKSTSGHDSQGDFEGLFSDLNLYSQDLGIGTEDKNDKIATILQKLSEVDFKFDNSDIDLLGDAYEYLISKFASDAGKKAGEFYTPQEVSKIITKLVTSDKSNIKTIYDPACGSGSLLLRVAREIHLDKIDLIAGEELNTTTYNLARMNMIIHNVKYDRFSIKNTDTLINPKFLDQKFDAIVANPPFSANWKVEEHTIEDVRFKNYGKLAPKGKADFAFVQHMVYQLNDEGIVATVLPHGPLFRGAAEKVIRQTLLDNNQIDAVIGLPNNIFFGTSIPTIILVLRKCKKTDDVLFIDASNDFEKVKTQNVLTDEHIDKIVNAYSNREEIDKYSRRVSMTEIIENEYNLNIPRYIDTFEEEDPIDINLVNANISELKLKMINQEKEIEEMLIELGLD